MEKIGKVKGFKSKKSTCVFEGTISEKTSIKSEVIKDSISKVTVSERNVDISMIK
jgi:hypothetical protein